MKTHSTDYTVHANNKPVSASIYTMVNLTNQSGSRLINQSGAYLVARTLFTGIVLIARETNYTVHAGG